MEMSFYTSDSYVNTLTVADFNLLSRASQWDTQRFELIEWFIKVKNLLWIAFLPSFRANFWDFLPLNLAKF